MPSAFVDSGTRMAASSEARPSNRRPVGSVTFARETLVLSGSLKRSTSTPGAALSRSPGVGCDETMAACAHAVPGTHRTHSAAMATIAPRVRGRTGPENFICSDPMAHPDFFVSPRRTYYKGSEHSSHRADLDSGSDHGRTASSEE